MAKLFHSFLAAALITSMGSLAMNQECITINDKQFTISIPQETIIKRIKELAAQITKDYAGQKPIFVCVLKGAFMFFSDLVREVGLYGEIDFIKVSSYGNQTKSSGSIKLVKDLSSKIDGRPVIIVEDIIDTGVTIKFIRDLISRHNPSSIRIASLLDKNLSNLDFAIDYVGFSIKPEFVIGYGLDYAQAGRTLKNIYKLVE
jgi:hypoxanthine phosphoribosyltransferase